VDVERHAVDIHVQLQLRGVDAAVRIGRQDDTTLVSRAIGASRRVLVASPGYLDARGAPESVAALADHDTIHFNPGSTAAEWRLTERGEARRIGITPRFTTNSADAAIGHARLGGGITQVLAYQVADAVRAGQLVVVLPQHEEAPLPIQVVFPSRLWRPRNNLRYRRLCRGLCPGFFWVPATTSG
jgi:DNA-binding transcriptional LysR family regulator